MLSNIIEIVTLSLIQGISEFLPISSSAHLVVVSTLYEFKSSSLSIDVSLHIGSFLAGFVTIVGTIAATISLMEEEKLQITQHG